MPLCVHTITTKPWSLEEALEHYPSAGVEGISVWTDSLNGRKSKSAGRQIREAGLEIVSLVRGGFFPAETEADRKKSIDDNLALLDQAAELGAPLIVLVCGAIPGQSLQVSRNQITKGIEAILSKAETLGIRLGIEPLHPMYADNRSAITSLGQANDICELLDSPNLGVTIDVYHTWWDPDLKHEIVRCGSADNIFSYHVCDWKTPTQDMLNDRGLMGEGCIDIKSISSQVKEAGFNGFTEVEIFSNHYWSMDQEIFLQKIVEAYRLHT